MFYYEDYAIKDIALELGISENTVKSRLKYGRDHLEQTITTLEKEQNFKLRGIAPIPLLYLLFRNVDALEIYVPKKNLVLTKTEDMQAYTRRTCTNGQTKGRKLCKRFV